MAYHSGGRSDPARRTAGVGTHANAATGQWSEEAVADLKKLYDTILNGDAKTTRKLVQEAIAEGIPPSILIDEAMIPAMAEVGRLYEEEEVFVPEMLLAARAMKAALEILRPLLQASGTQPAGRVVICTKSARIWSRRCWKAPAST